MPIAVCLLAIAWTVLGLVMMVTAAPAVPYADPWRYLATYLGEPFPGNVLRVDNGHCEVLPDLVRFADLRWCHADQSLQLGFAVATALLVVATVCLLARRGGVGWLLPAAFCIGVFWLGNGRKLAHGNESVPLFLILLFLVNGLRLAARGEGIGPHALLAVTLCGVAATFTFGSGIACFVAFGAALWLRRAPRREWLPLMTAGIVTLLTFFAIASHQVNASVWALGERCVVWLHWLGAPFVSATSPLLDPEHAARQPELVRSLAAPIATWVHAACGPSATAHLPAAFVGAAGVTWLLAASWRHRRDGGSELQRLGLGVAWFALAVGVLVAAARLEYFRNRPDQIVSARYLPWSILLWTGLVMAHVAAPARSRRARAATVLAFALLLLPSQVWNARAAFRLQQVAERTAVGAAVGVLDDAYPLVESRLIDVQRSLPLLREAGAAMFAWPATRQLGQPVAAGASAPVEVHDLVVAPAINRLGGTALRVRFRCEESAVAHLMLVDADGIARGLAMRDEGDEWLGWLPEPAPVAGLRIVRLH